MGRASAFLSLLLSAVAAIPAGPAARDSLVPQDNVALLPALNLTDAGNLPRDPSLLRSFAKAQVQDNDLYCPTEADMNLEYGNVVFSNGGWTIFGGGRVSSKTSWNLLGGYIDFDMDVSSVANNINSNFYTTSPATPNCGMECYCDIQSSGTGRPSCMELDLIENNGHCGLATTLHTFATDGVPNNSNCDRWGCGSDFRFSNNKVHVHTEFGEDGSTTVFVDGVANNGYSPSPSGASNTVVVNTMKSVGAVIQSSMWFGWVPMDTQCPGGDQSGLDNSKFAISNVQIYGSVIQGPGATKCGNTPVTPTPTPQPVAKYYCPNQYDMISEHGAVTFKDNGWTLTGDSRVSSKTSWNLLGGFIEFTLDLSHVAPEINTNLYTSSPPQPNCGAACYCDIQSGTNPSCTEMDIIENNGQCALASTIHTFATDGVPNNANCDRWGCGSSMRVPSSVLDVKASFGTDGSLTVTVNGVANNNYGPSPSADSNKVVVQTMTSVGAVIESSQWYGWVPSADSCPKGDRSGLANSKFVVSNVVVSGSVVQGPEPSVCASTPTPQPTPQPAPPTPQPSKKCDSCQGGACGCSWVNAVTCSGDGDGTCCFKCCCNK